MKTGNYGLGIIKHYESCKLVAYLCPAGIWTIGWGTTKYANGQRVEEGDRITQAQADVELENMVGDAERIIARHVRKPLNQNQFDALVSFIYNVGAPQFASSTMLSLLNAGDYAGAAGQFERWTLAKGVKLKGLVLRRDDEKECFLLPTIH